MVTRGVLWFDAMPCAVLWCHVVWCHVMWCHVMWCAVVGLAFRLVEWRVGCLFDLALCCVGMFGQVALFDGLVDCLVGFVMLCGVNTLRGVVSCAFACCEMSCLRVYMYSLLVQGGGVRNH